MKNYSKHKENDNYYYEDDEIDLYELLLILKKRAKLILLTTLLFLLVSLIYIFLIAKPIYKSEAALLPIEKDKLSKLSLLIGLDIPGLDKGGTSSSIIIAVLSSRTIKERVIKKLNLMPKLFPKRWDKVNNKWILEDNSKPPTLIDGASKLEKMIDVSTDKKTGIINVAVEFPNEPEMAYKINKALIEETKKMLNEKSFTIAKVYRQYLGKQLIKLKEYLDKLEKIYLKFSKGEIREVPLIFFEEDEVIKTLYKEKYFKEKYLNKKDFLKIKNKIKNVNKKLQSLKERNFVAVHNYKFNMGKLKLQFLVLEDLFRYLLKEYELAKAKEKKEEIMFQVIDEPYIPNPDKPYKPKKLLIIVISVVSGLFMGIFLAFFLEWFSNVKANMEEKHNENKISNSNM